MRTFIFGLLIRVNVLVQSVGVLVSTFQPALALAPTYAVTRREDAHAVVP